MSLRQETILGIAWTGIGNIGSTLLNFIIVAILAHLLEPSDFGMMGIIVVVTGFVTMIADAGVGTAIVQEQHLTPIQFSTFFYLNLAVGLGLSISVFLLASPVSAFFHREDLVPLLQFSSSVFVLTGVALTFRAQLQKQMRFKQLIVVDSVGVIAYGVCAITLALNSFGVRSLVFGLVARQVVETALLWAATRHKPSFMFRLEGIKGLLAFGFYVMGERIMNYFNRNLPNILIGRFLGTEALGYYYLAYQVMLTPISRVSQVVGRVTYPAFSRMQENNEKLRDGYILEIRYIALITFPLMGIMFVLAPEIITSIYGGQWGPSIIILQIFCVLGLVESIGTTVGGILYAKKRADIAFTYNIANSLVIAFAILLGMSYGINGIAIAITIASFPLAYLWHSKTNSLIGLSWGRFLRAMGFSTFITVIFLIVLDVGKMGVQNFLQVRSSVAMIALLLVFATLSYVMLVVLFKRSLIHEAKQIMRTLVAYRHNISSS